MVRKDTVSSEVSRETIPGAIILKVNNSSYFTHSLAQSAGLLIQASIDFDGFPPDSSETMILPVVGLEEWGDKAATVFIGR